MPKYEVKEVDGKTIILRYDENTVSSFLASEDNADYQRYLAWLENPEAEQSTLGPDNV
jgi:hypothetical protein